jgi:type II secretory pathway pseudopilin PulG
MKTVWRSIAQAREAFSLVEVTIALGIVAFGVVAIFALLPAGLQLVRESTDESIASGILTMMASDVQAKTTNPSESPRFTIRLTSGTKAGILHSNGNGGLLFDASGRYLGFGGVLSQARFVGSYSIRPGTDSPANALLMVSWPAQAATPSGRIETLIALP